MREPKTENIEIHEAESTDTGAVPLRVSSEEVRSRERSRALALFLFVLLMSVLGASMIFKGVEEAGAIGTIFFENIKPRFFIGDPLEKYDRLVEAASLNKKDKKYKAALLLIDAAENETKGFGASNVYMAYLLSLKGDCVYELGDKKGGRSLLKRSIRMWYATRGRRTSVVAAAWERLGSMYANVDKEICQKCLLNAVWSLEHSQGPFCREAIMDKNALLNHPNLIFPYSSLQYDDFKCEKGELFAERIKSYEDISDLQEHLISIMDEIPVNSKVSPVVPPELIEPIVQFNHRYKSDQTKAYPLHNSMITYSKGDNALVQNLSLRIRLLNRQATLLHLMKRHKDAILYEQKADNLLRRLLQLDPEVDIRSKYNELVQRYLCSDDWFPDDE